MPSRVAIIRGLRTPFAKSGTHYARLTALDLGKMAVAELIERSGIDPKSVQEVVFGNVIPSVKAPNIAREIILGTGLPRKIPGYTVGKACASANQAIAAASTSRRFKDEVMTVVLPPSFDTVIETDNLIRADTTLESLSKLRPVFDRKYGTLTAGNSSPLTDGAAAVLLMSEEKAQAEGLKPIGFLKSYAFAATDPFDQLLQGPVFALPIALERAGITLKDIGVIEMHEAFAAQVLSNIQWMRSKKIAQEKLGRSEPVGDSDQEKINRTGGSIALRHS